MSGAEFLAGPGGIGRLLVQGLAVPDAALQELRPLRNDRERAFPHQSTGDQWFSESQFESYRALGSYTVSQICEKKKPDEVNTVAEFIEAAQEYAK